MSWTRELKLSTCIVYMTGAVNEQDERAYIDPHDTIFVAPLGSSLEPSPIPGVNLPLLGARLHGLDLLLIGQIIYSMLAVVVQFTCGSITGGDRCN